VSGPENAALPSAVYGVVAVSKGVPELLVKFAQLADAEGDVPDDGSGIDGIWTTTVPARDRDDQDWHIAMNANTDDETEAIDFPSEGDVTTVPKAGAVVYLHRTPAALVGPGGGSLAVKHYASGPDSIEDELIADVDARLEEAESGGDSP